MKNNNSFVIMKQFSHFDFVRNLWA